MKKNFLVMILVTFWVQSISQSIVDSNKLWSNLIYHEPLGNISTENIRFTVDTIINLQTYKRVERSLDETLSNWYFYGYIREDANKRVYYRMNAIEPERLLYDLGLTLNDSILVYGLSSNYDSVFLESVTYHVTTIDSIMIGTTYKKQLHLSYRMFPDSSLVEVEQWVDSVGSMSGMLHNFSPLLGNDTYHLLCYSENDILKYHNPSFTSCYVFTSVDPILNSSEIVKISPNPVADVSSLIVNGINGNEELTMDLYNSLGQKVLDKKFTRVTQIYRNQLSPGIYFYKIYFKSGKIASGKLVVN